MFNNSFEKHELEGECPVWFNIKFIIYARNVTSEGFFVAPENFSERGQKVNNSCQKDAEGLCAS